MSAKNQVVLAGKVSKVRDLKYTPSGTCVGELVLAVQQAHLEKPSMGYFEIVLTGDLARESLSEMKIGDFIQVSGKLWSRSYKNRQGDLVTETKVLADEVKEGIDGQIS